MKKLVVISVVVFCMSVVSVASAQTTYYVNGTCGDDGWAGLDPNCEAPSNNGPFQTISRALNVAMDGDTIIVADGTYSGPDNIMLTIASAILLRSENGPTTCVINCQSAGYALRFPTAVMGDAVLEGFRITGGDYNNNGGALICSNDANPTIRNCVFDNNHAQNLGGAVYCNGVGCSPLFTDCTFSTNSSDYAGGAIACDNGSNPTITYCQFNNNFSDQEGGAIYSQMSTPTITYSEFISNNAGEQATSNGLGGAIRCIGGSSPTISHCTFNNNKAWDTGGAISCYTQSSPIISSCTIINNYAYRKGGAIDCDVMCNPTIDDCTISLNDTEEDGGAISCTYSSNPMISYSTISNNTAGINGGGLACDQSSPILTSCDFENNESTFFGGGIYLKDGSDAIISSCGITGNTVTEYSSGFGGGGLCSLNSNPLIMQSQICTNFAHTGGGVLAIYGSSVTLMECSINNNQADSSGGGLHAEDNGMPVTINISGCSFTANVVQNGVGGAISGVGQTSLNITQSTLTRNDSSGPGAVFMAGENGLVMDKCLIAANNLYDPRYSVYCTQTTANITNCSFAQNTGGVFFDNMYGMPKLRNCIMWYNVPIGEIGGDSPMVSYCDITGYWPGTGNINKDPNFAMLGYMDDQGTPEIEDDVWVDGDYHLRSRAGRWDPVCGTWILDEVTSPCVDTGDPGSGVGEEPMPNGERINIGAYGGTEQASKSVFCWAVIPGDSNSDCRVNLLDLAIMATHWLECNLIPPDDCWQ